MEYVECRYRFTVIQLTIYPDGIQRMLHEQNIAKLKFRKQ